MVDKIKVTTTERNGVELEYREEGSPNSDYAALKGVALENSDDNRIHKGYNEVAFADPVNGTKKVSDLLAGTGMTPSEHRDLDQLVHNIMEDFYCEVTRVSNKISNVTFWDSVSKTLKIRETDITRTDGKVTEMVTKQYNSSGVLVETLTETIARTNGKITSITGVLT